MTHTKWSTIKERRFREPAAREAYEQTARAIALGEQVRSLRRAKRWSQAQLAARLRTTQSAVSRLEMGDMPPSLRTLSRIGDALGVELVVAFREPRTTQSKGQPRAAGARAR